MTRRAATVARKFKQVDYDAVIHLTIRLGDCVPPGHLAQFVVEVVALLDLTAIYARYGSRGAPPYAPEILLALLFYGYATGVFSSRKLEQATYECLPFRFIAGDLHPDHDTIATFRKTFLPELQELFTQVLLLAHVAGVLKLGRISLDGTKLHADASKSKAVSDRRLLELEVQLSQEVSELLALAERTDRGEPQPEGLVIEDEIHRRQDRLTNLAKAKAVLEARAEERYRLEQSVFEDKVREREEKARARGGKPRGRASVPPTPGARDKDQYNFTDPDSRIMKNSTHQGVDQHYNAQVATDQETLLIVGHALSNHPNDQGELAPTLAAIPAAVGTLSAAALDNGYFSAANIAHLQERGIEPYIATGREAHHRSWRDYFAATPSPPPEDASATVKMAYRLQTEIGKAIYRLRKCTVEPVIGIIKEILGFRQFSLRGMAAAAGEWGLVCLAFNLKRLHTLTNGHIDGLKISPTGC
jgi:transposase